MSKVTLLMLTLLFGVSCESENKLTLTVFAASSLTDVFRDLEAAFEDTHPNVNVRLNFAGSQMLRTQIELGAKADVFASASAHDVEVLMAAGVMNNAQAFTRNDVVFATPPHSSLTSVSDITANTTVIAGSAASPIGGYTDEFIDRLEVSERALAATIRASLVSRESNVRLVVSKLVLGEADGGFVYRTDVMHTELRVVELPEATRPSVEYFTGVVRAGELAKQWNVLLLSDEGLVALRRHGFSDLGAR